MKTVAELFANINVMPGSCWLWTRSTKTTGYGEVYWRGRRAQTVHRLIYELLVGPIPEGLELGHMCHDNDESCTGGSSCLHRRCVNLSHLKPMTRKENLTAGRRPGRKVGQWRWTHCKRGHLLEDPNVIYGRDGRQCRMCNTIGQRRRYRQRKGQM